MSIGMLITNVFFMLCCAIVCAILFDLHCLGQQFEDAQRDTARETATETSKTATTATTGHMAITPKSSQRNHHIRNVAPQKPRFLSIFGLPHSYSFGFLRSLAWPSLALVWPALALALAWLALALAWPALALAWPALALAWPALAWPALALAWPALAWPGRPWPGLAGLALAWPGLALAWPN